jgi:hypothetical protein
MASTQEKVQDKAQEAGEQAKSRVSDELDRRSTEVGEQATSIADAIRKASQQLQEQGKDSAAKPMQQAAERVESAGSWLRDADGDQILRDVENFGRRKPGAVLAGGLLVGFALSRLLKASSTQRYQSSGTTGYTGPERQIPLRTTAPANGVTGTAGTTGTTPPITSPEPGFGSGATAPGSTTPGTTPGTGGTRSY